MYPADANFIVSLLDIHATASPAVEDTGPCLEILEAGTGHGALTIHLARAIHAANASVSSVAGLGESPLGENSRPRRQAVVHTVDVSSQVSKHAKSLVHGFRRGLYSNDIQFYVSDVSEWIDRRQLRAEGEKTFLSHIILDMPDSYKQIEKVASVLHPYGNLILFNPSITQIIAAVEEIKKYNIAVYLDRVLELGPTMTGGKEWDIRAVKPRALGQAESMNGKAMRTKEILPNSAENNTEPSALEGTSDEGSIEGFEEDIEETEALGYEQQGYRMVCRPKAYARVVGGGFVGLWKKKNSNQRHGHIPP